MTVTAPQGAQQLEATVAALIAPGRGILAADESDATVQKRFEAVGIENTEENRRRYRNLFFTTPGIAEFISGVILFDAAACQEAGLVPIVEPEVLMDGAHTIERCFDVTEATLHRVFRAVHDHHVLLEYTLLKPNMVVAGTDSSQQAGVTEVAEMTVRCLRRTVPAAVPGIVFLSGGQSAQRATEHLNAMNGLPGPRPWPLSFSFARALQAPALEAWRGDPSRVGAAQKAFHHRAACNAAARDARYTSELERAVAEPTRGRRDR